MSDKKDASRFKNMNKKGAFFHWIIYGFIGALAIFFIASNVGVVDPGVKGQWQLDFLKNNFLEAEKELLKNDIIIKQVGIEVVKELANNAGYQPGKQSSCGKVGNSQVWLKEGKWCFQGINEIFSQMMKLKLDKKMPNNKYSEISFNGPFITGKGEKGVISREMATYTFDTSFSVYLGYSFDEYEMLQEEGIRLVASCGGDENLKSCLDNAKQAYWKYGSCENENFPNSKIVAFCVTSPKLSYLQENGVQKIVTYNIAFDFSMKPQI